MARVVRDAWVGPTTDSFGLHITNVMNNNELIFFTLWLGEGRIMSWTITINQVSAVL